VTNNKGTSVQLKDFPADELEHLATFYPFIRSQLAREREFISATLPQVQGVEQQLHALRELEARGELWIRISGAGNLNVWARERSGVFSDTREGVGYLTIVKFPSLARLRAAAAGGRDPLEHPWRFGLRLPTTITRCAGPEKSSSAIRTARFPRP